MHLSYFIFSQQLILFYFSLTVVYVSFRGNSISVLENQTEVNVCLELRNVSAPTLAEIWVDIVSDDMVATATGKIHTSQYQTVKYNSSLL